MSMNHPGIRSLFAAAAWLLALCGLLHGAVAAEQLLVDFGGDFDPAAVEARDVQLSRHGTALRLETGHKNQWPGITLDAPQGRWDLSAFEYVAMEVANVGSNRVEISCRIDSAAGGVTDSMTESIGLAPGEKKTLEIMLRRKFPPELRAKLFGMRGYPGGWVERGGIDARNVNRLTIFVAKPTADHVFEIARIRAGGSSAWLGMDQGRLFPLIDPFGQFIHRDWPGKTKSVDDLARRRQEEAADLAARPGPEDWDSYGGWQAGPQLKSTGRFRVEKHRGKWWLVDPQGRLFWSHGTDCVGSGGGTTPITDREHWFAQLPKKDSAWGQFYGAAAWAPHGYYQGKSYQTYNFTAANLLHKYGPQWKREFAEITHQRLRSWGMNTIANWSDPGIYLLRKTPYTATISIRSKSLEGSAGYWGKFPDVFDSSFRQAFEQRMRGGRQTTAGDPWCIGYFVDNELSWGDELSLAAAALVSPADQPAKRVFVEDLKKKYETIERLNQTWGTSHASWDALLQETKPPDPKRAYDDLAAFYTKTAERYFQTCRDAVKKADPGGLYLGCRFAWVNDRAVRAAAKYCDVISFNRYSRSVADFRLPQGVDKPVLIGEFHFGALDRGMFHTGLVPVANQQARAEAYRSYVRGALANPWIVGTHWFQYGDQPTTGRGDGENYQIGLLDVCDTPYPDTIEAVREVGYGLYAYREAGEKTEGEARGK
jgi:hypothetical protein